MDGLKESRAEAVGGQSAAEKQWNASPSKSSSPNKPTPQRNQDFIVLNGRWRVKLTDRTSWILERRQGLNADGSPRYRERSYCTQRRVLFRDIRDYAGPVDPVAVAMVAALPERFPYRRQH